MDFVGEGGAPLDAGGGGFDAGGEAARGSADMVFEEDGVGAAAGGLGGGFWGLLVVLFFCPPFFLAISTAVAGYVDEYVSSVGGVY